MIENYKRSLSTAGHLVQSSILLKDSAWSSGHGYEVIQWSLQRLLLTAYRLLPWVPEVSRSRRAGAEITGGGRLVARRLATSPPPPVISAPALRERETSGTQGNRLWNRPLIFHDTFCKQCTSYFVTASLPKVLGVLLDSPPWLEAPISPSPRCIFFSVRPEEYCFSPK